MQHLVEVVVSSEEEHRVAHDEMPRAKGPTTRAMARRIQEEWALNAHARPRMNFTWAKEDVKT